MASKISSSRAQARPGPGKAQIIKAPLPQALAEAGLPESIAEPYSHRLVGGRRLGS